LCSYVAIMILMKYLVYLAFISVDYVHKMAKLLHFQLSASVQLPKSEDSDQDENSDLSDMVSHQSCDRLCYYQCPKSIF
jgi:hypothetical protein